MFQVYLNELMKNNGLKDEAKKNHQRQSQCKVEIFKTIEHAMVTVKGKIKLSKL